ncbi:MAG TPA: DUF3570 domain-containing protein [Burkholderiaceae bacterium]|nr:DUF3570 domain-containing protein [Burkholderiaceae bacterium]
MAATSRLWAGLLTSVRHAARAARARWARWIAPLAGLIGGAMPSAPAVAMTLPEDTAEAIYHLYDGGGVTAQGPALLVRKSLYDKVSLTGTYYVDMVSNASIDVVTTASPFKETRTEYSVGADYAYRDSLLSVGYSSSDEPDYKAQGLSIDAAQEVFGSMTTIKLGFTRGKDDVGKKGEGFFDYAKHWRYRLGVTQIITPRWLATLNVEAVSDEGFLGSPYRAARVFGSLVPERNPRTRSSRAIKAGAIGEIMPRTSLHADYRYFWDTWDIKAHTFEVGGSRYFGESFLIDGYLRYYKQSKALFYFDNAPVETTYVSRNRQLSTYDDIAPGVRVTYQYKQVPGKYEIQAHLNYEYQRYKFSDFTDIRTGQLYSYGAHVLQLLVTATF